MSVDITTALGEAAVVELSQKKNEPQWIKDQRLAAFKNFLSAPNPDWKRIDVGQVEFAGIETYRESARVSDVSQLPDQPRQVISGADADGALLLQVDSTAAFLRLGPELQEKGVVFTSLDDAVKNHEALVKEHMFSAIAPDAHRFVSLHAALQSGGAFVYVPKNVRVETPLEFIVYSDSDGLGLFPHVLVVADEGSEVTVIERYLSNQSDRHVVSQVVEVIAKANANVTFGSIQSWGDETASFHERRAVLHRDSTVNWVLGELGSRLSRATTHSRLEGNGSQSGASMVIFADQSQQLDAGLIMNHVGHYTSSDMLTKSVLKDKAKAVYRALTDIEDGAINTSGFQVENALILNKGARIDAIPELEIEETEVQAGHAATVGQVDETMLFYMMSRGVPRPEAIKLIVEGFLDPLLSRIPLDDVREDLQKLIDRKMTR